MKKTALFSMMFALAFANAWAGGSPRGTLLELHSCDLYAGGCVVSSQATLEGRYMLRAWNFAGGQYAGQELRGLRLAILQSGSENLAAKDGAAEQAVIYLPQDAAPAKRESLLNWAKTSLIELKSAKIRTRIVPLQWAATKIGFSFSAGDFAAVRTTPLESCQTGACGEALWYTPRSSTSLFTVAVDSSSRVIEPFLRLKWSDAGQRSVFLAKFGEETPAQNQFVTTADFCSSTGTLFQ